MGCGLLGCSEEQPDIKKKNKEINVKETEFSSSILRESQRDRGLNNSPIESIGSTGDTSSPMELPEVYSQHFK